MNAKQKHFQRLLEYLPAETVAGMLAQFNSDAAKDSALSRKRAKQRHEEYDAFVKRCLEKLNSND